MDCALQWTGRGDPKSLGLDRPTKKVLPPSLKTSKFIILRTAPNDAFHYTTQNFYIALKVQFYERLETLTGSSSE